MPQINVLFWNIENFGVANRYKSHYGPLTNFVADVCRRLEVDLLFVQELKQAGVQHLATLGAALSGNPPRDNWHFDWIRGGLALQAPYAAAANTCWSGNHSEGYAVFWNQNIAKHTPTLAPPVPPAGGVGPAVANTQSGGVCRFQGGAGGWGTPVPAGGVQVPADPAYVLPAATRAPAGAAIVNGGGGVLVPAGGALALPTTVNSGTSVPAQALIGPLGITLNPLNTPPGLFNPAPVVVPGNYVLESNLVLPAQGSVVVPEHVLSLVVEGRDTRTAFGLPSEYFADIKAHVPAFAPGGLMAWQELCFPRGVKHQCTVRRARRPAYLQLDVNLAPAAPAGQRLVPVIAYHAPSSAAAANVGLQRASYSRPLYQAYDPQAGFWVDSTHAVLGGDFNSPLRQTQYPYEAFTNAFPAGGANCQIRIDHPAAPGQGPWENPINKTMCQLADRLGVVINAPNTNAYRKRAIDNVFHRGFGPLPALPPVDAFDVLPSLMGAAVPAALNTPLAPVQQFLLLAAFAAHWNVMNGWPAGPGGLLMLPEILNLEPFLRELNAGRFGGLPLGFGARRAAELMKLCISDHQPVLFPIAM